jgi:hypothetical protein
MTFTNMVSLMLSKKSCPTADNANSYFIILETLGETMVISCSLQDDPGDKDQLLLNSDFPFLDNNNAFKIKMSICSGQSVGNSTIIFSETYLTHPCNFDTEILLPVKDPATKKSLFHIIIEVKELAASCVKRGETN